MRRGDIYFVDLDPVQGREQRGHRPVFVVSPDAFNRFGAPLVAPITSGGSFARHRGFACDLAGHTSRVQGVVLCNQLRTLDIAARRGRFVETAPDSVIRDVLARVLTLVT